MKTGSFHVLILLVLSAHNLKIQTDVHSAGFLLSYARNVFFQQLLFGNNCLTFSAAVRDIFMHSNIIQPLSFSFPGLSA